jgi:hypothetical protein
MAEAQNSHDAKLPKGRLIEINKWAAKTGGGTAFADAGRGQDGQTRSGYLSGKPSEEDQVNR